MTTANHPHTVTCSTFIRTGNMRTFCADTRGAMSKPLIFTLLVMDSIGHNFHGIWRHPRARNRDFNGFDLWVDLAKKAERAKIDAFFFTDVIGVQGEYNGSRDVIFEM